MDKLSSSRAVTVMSVFCLLAGGCATIDRFNTKLDMASEHMLPQKSVYEGQLAVVLAVGSMMSLQFIDGKVFEVRSGPPGLVRGDIVRLTKVGNEYEAHLWRAAESVPSPEANALAPLITPAK